MTGVVDAATGPQPISAALSSTTAVGQSDVDVLRMCLAEFEAFLPFHEAIASSASASVAVTPTRAEINISNGHSNPPDDEIVNALRHRITELEDENLRLRSELSALRGSAALADDIHRDDKTAAVTAVSAAASTKEASADAAGKRDVPNWYAGRRTTPFTATIPPRQPPIEHRSLPLRMDEVRRRAALLSPPPKAPRHHHSGGVGQRTTAVGNDNLASRAASSWMVNAAQIVSVPQHCVHPAPVPRIRQRGRSESPQATAEPFQSKSDR